MSSRSLNGLSNSSVRSLNGLSNSTSTLSGGTAISIVNNSINLDIGKSSLVSTTAASDQYILEDSSGNTKKILYSNLIGSTGSGLSAGEALTITSNVLDVSISKQSFIITSDASDQYLLEDASGNIKKITYSNFNSGLQSQITSLNSSVSTNTSNIALNTAAISNLVSTANSTNFGTTASSGITVGNSSQTLALNSASMNSISSGKNFFRSNLSSGLGFQIQGFNSGGVSYTSVIEVHNVASGFPYLNLLMGNGFSINQYTGQNRNLIVDVNGKLNISNDLPITYTGGDGINISGSNAIVVDISKQVAITTPASSDVFLVERDTGVINKIAYSDMGIGVVAGNAIAVSSGRTVNVEISKENTITNPASSDLFLLEQASDGVLKNITYGNLISGVDITTATSIGTAATGAITVGNANNQTINLVGSTLNITGSNTITNRSSVSSGVSFKVDGFNSNDVAYYESLKLDNSNVAGVRPTISLLGSSGFYGGVGQNLTIDSNGKIDWITPSTSGTVLEQYNTTTDLLNSVQTSGKMALVKNPLKLWVYANLSSGLVWRSLSFDTATNLSLNTSTYQLNSGSITSFNSGATIIASSTGDVVKISVKVNDDLNPTVVNSLTNSTQTALDGWNGSAVVSMANAFSITDNQDGTYTYEGQVKTKNQTDTTAISYTITDINSSTILTFNYSIQNSPPMGFGTGSPSSGSYYAIYSVSESAYFRQTSTDYTSLGGGGGNNAYTVNAGLFDNTNTPSDTSNNNPMIFHYTQLNYNGTNITQFFATTYNGSAGSYTSYSARNFPAGHSTGNMSFTATGTTDEFYMYSSNYQMSITSQKIGFAASQNTTYTDSTARWKFYKVA